MTSIKFENIWSMMRKYKFNIPEKALTDVFCYLCKEVMIDPYITGCECKFCFECIRSSSGNYCPGGKEECFEEYLEIDKTIVRDLKTRQNISHMEVQCPHEFCSVYLPLGKMDDHIRMCTSSSESCPFQLIGCPEDRLFGINISDHLQRDTLEHSQLLIETINHWRNDVKKLREMDQIKDEERKKFVTEISRNRNQINELEERCQRNDAQMKEVVKEMRREIAEEIERIRTEMMTMRFGDSVERYEASDVRIREEIKSLKNDIRRTYDDIQRINRCLREMNLIHDFIWTICDISTKRQQFYESTSFYKDNYKACMRIWIDGYNLHLYLCMIKGEMDDNLEWPIRHTVILGILNQETMRTHVSSRYSVETQAGNKSAYNRPCETRNEHIGGMKVLRSDIAHIPGLLCNDSVIVTCSLIRS